MLNYRKMVVVCLSTFIGLALAAADLVTNVTIRQVRPWQGMVEVDYELTEDRSSDLGLSTSVTFMDKQNNKVYDAKTFTHSFTYTKGAKRMIWNAAKDNVAFKSSNVVCKVELKRELYCVIDLSGGTSATSYPVTTLSAVPVGGWTDEYKSTKLVLRYIEPGTFMMGSPSDELGRNPVAVQPVWLDPERQHAVTLTEGFYIGVFEVTQRQWELVRGDRPSSYGDSENYATLPVDSVSWNMIRVDDANYYTSSFLSEIRERTGLLLDLPTEAQWEYACRAGTTTALNSGKNLTSTGQCPNMDEVGRYGYNGERTAKVGSYLPNNWGLYDMHGNVAEWCLDWFEGYTDSNGNSKYRVLRGGSNSSLCGADRCRSSAHGWNAPQNINYGTTGFRLVCSIKSAE